MAHSEEKVKYENDVKQRQNLIKSAALRDRMKNAQTIAYGQSANALESKRLQVEKQK